MRGWVARAFGLFGLTVVLSRCGSTSEADGEGGVDAVADLTAPAEGNLDASGAPGDRGIPPSGGDGAGGPGAGPGADGVAPDGTLLDTAFDAAVDAAADRAEGGASDAGCDASCGILRCCGGQCVNGENDPTNCGGCGNVCGGGTPYCQGSCEPNPCWLDAGSCEGTAGAFCCGTSCCTEGQICCGRCGPVVAILSCYTPTEAHPTCPIGDPQCASDRALKRDIVPVDEQSVLDKVARLPIATWSYIADPPTVRHMGPMAQDFHATFGLGDSDRTYNPVDAHGVALAAIKALNDRLDEQERRIESLERQNEELRRARCSAAR